MSSSTPGGPRRRRIAGERRGRALPSDEQSPAATSAPASTPVEKPVVKPAEKRASVPLDKPAKPAAKPVTPPKAKSVTPPVAKPLTAPAAERTPEPVPEAGDESDSSDGRRPDGRWGSRLSLVVLSAVLVVLLLLTGLAALGLLGTDGVQDVNETEAVDRSMRTAPAAAEAAAAAILAYDHKSLDADQDAAARFMTDEFAEEYSETFEKVVRPAAEANRAKVTASVLASAVMRATEDTARVLVFVDQATTSTESEGPRIALNRVEMSMVREGDSWLVADISSY